MRVPGFLPLVLASASSTGAARLSSPSQSRSFEIRQGMTLRADPVDPLFCGEGEVDQYSGYFKIEDEESTDKEYFFWFFESQDQPLEDPVVVWLTGGPGCSSTLALLVENGPCSVNDDGETTTPNPYAWNKRANVIWVDQPAGVGFSYGKAPEDYDHNEDEVGEDMYWFLQAFFQEFSEFAPNPFFVFGESYGGHYVPAISHRVWLGNKEGEEPLINLTGLGIGNGMTVPEIQYQYYTEMALDNPYNVQAVTDQQAEFMQAATQPCVALIQGCQDVDEVCSVAQNFCELFVYGPYMLSGLNPYDIRIPCGEADLCYDFTAVEKFLRLNSTREALNVREESAEWQSCNTEVNQDFSTDFMKNFDGYVGELLDDGMPVLIYAGDADFICNYLGNEAWTNELEWTGAEGFRGALQEDWTPMADMSPAGLWKTYGGFTFLRVFGAGHMASETVTKKFPDFFLEIQVVNLLRKYDPFMSNPRLISLSLDPHCTVQVPMDQPEVSLSMLNGFIHGDSRSVPAEQGPRDASAFA